MDINSLDLNLLRVFDAIYRLRSVSRAAQSLGLSQPATSQALTRLRLLLSNPLFERTHGGVRPTARADQLAITVSAALRMIETGVREALQFDPGSSKTTFRLHMSDIGEARFLPQLTQYLQQHAPHIQLQSRPWPLQEIEDALHRGTLDAAIGFLPQLQATQHVALVQDRYVVLLRHHHPALRSHAQTETGQWLQALEYVAISSHSVPLQILRELQLEHRVRLTAAHFLAVPHIVHQSDLAVVIPLQIAQTMIGEDHYTLLELPAHTQRHFTVHLHWSQRWAHEPAKQWLLQCIQRLFAASASVQSTRKPIDCVTLA